MTWIRTLTPDAGSPQLQQIYQQLHSLYPPEYAQSVPILTRPDGHSDSVMGAHTLIPEALWHMMAGLAVLLREEHGLTRRQQEMIATVVSARNRCFY